MKTKKIALVDQIYLDLLSKIKTGKYKNGSKLPSEKELCAKYQVSRITARNAVLRLVDNGLVSRRKKGGTVVGNNTFLEKNPAISIILPYIDDTIHGILYGAQKKAAEYGYTVKWYNSNNNPLEERKILEQFVSCPPPALIIYPCSQTDNIPVISKLYSKNTPMVFIDREIVGTDCPLITSNNAEAMFDLTRKIIRKGYKRLSFYGFFDNSLSTTQERLNGFCMAHSKCKLPIYENFLINSSTNQANSLSDLEKILKSDNRPEVICCLHDYLALDIIKKANELGLRVPEDLGVTGFDNRVPPPLQSNLTTIEQNFYEIGTAAVTIAREMINGNKPQRRTRIKAQLIIRDSVKNL